MFIFYNKTIILKLSLLSIFMSGCVVDKRMVVSDLTLNQKISESKVDNANKSKIFNKINEQNIHVKRLKNSLTIGGQRNYVLNAARLGIVLFELKRYEESLNYFKKSGQIIQTFYNNNIWAEKSKEIFTTDSIKDFKGDSYERAMVFYYTALSYLKLGETDNARASLKVAFSQDNFAEDKKYQSDFYLMPLLEAWILKCEGRENESKQLIDRFIPQKFKIKLKNTLPNSNIKNVTILEVGKSPVKEAVGRYMDSLIYRTSNYLPRNFIDYRTRKKLDAYLVGDINFQAKTRGGRYIDGIVKNKVVFRKGAENFSNVSLGVAVVSANVAISAALLNDDTDVAVAAAALAGAALAASAISESIAMSAATKADTRYIDNLPSKILFIHNYKSNYLLSQPSVNEEKIQTLTLFKNNNCQINWARTNKSWSIPSIAPNSMVFTKESNIKEK